MAELNQTPSKIAAVPGKIAWKLLLSVIIINGVFFVINLAAFLYNTFEAYITLNSHISGTLRFTGLFGALIYYWFVAGLLNRNKLVKRIILIRSMFYMIYCFSVSIEAWVKQITGVEIRLYGFLDLDLDHWQMVLFFGSLALIQLYQIYILLRKDVSGLFSSTLKREPLPAPAVDEV